MNRPHLYLIHGREAPVLREEVHPLGRDPLWLVALQVVAGGIAFLALMWGMALIFLSLAHTVGQ